MAPGISNNILLTGAGFTKNFGGFLATEMWEKIFNCSEVQKSPDLVDILRNDFDYESVYHKIFAGDYSNDVKDAINSAMLQAYRKLDKIGQDYISTTDESKLNILNGAKKIIDLLSQNNQKTFFFTLNQDLFIERLISGITPPIITPMMERFFPPNSNESKQPLDNNNFKIVPTKAKIDSNKEKIFNITNTYYIKLHGSFGWKSSDGSSKMVIGRNKITQIANEPLLLWYFDVFKEELFRARRKLLVIGYGFRDIHINEIIAKAIKSHGLKLYIVSPTAPNTFKERLIKADSDNGQKIFQGLTGYISANFHELFPSNSNETDEWRELKEIFFTG
ncbi:MAG: SIR2 family protein [Proteobacteria bacterium]|nr:SIR2 family protein [Pseudomonadota bacterium]